MNPRHVGTCSVILKHRVKKSKRFNSIHIQYGVDQQYSHCVKYCAFHESCQTVCRAKVTYSRWIDKTSSILNEVLWTYNELMSKKPLLEVDHLFNVHTLFLGEKSL